MTSSGAMPSQSGASDAYLQQVLGALT
jgi:hypothetical protein